MPCRNWPSLWKNATVCCPARPVAFRRLCELLVLVAPHAPELRLQPAEAGCLGSLLSTGIANLLVSARHLAQLAAECLAPVLFVPLLDFEPFDRRVSRAYIFFSQPLDFELCDSPDYASVLAVHALLQILLQLPNATLDCSDGDSDATTATDDDFGICSLSLVDTPKNSARGRKTVDKTVPFARESLNA
jgi:hypothetical protein